MDGRAWWATVHGVVKSRTQLSDFILTFHFHALEKETATPVFLPGEPQRRGSLVGCRLWGRSELATTEGLSSGSGPTEVNPTGQGLAKPQYMSPPPHPVSTANTDYQPSHFPTSGCKSHSASDIFLLQSPLPTTPTHSQLTGQS